MLRDRWFRTAFLVAFSGHGLGLAVIGLVQRGHVAHAPVASRQLEVGVWSFEPEGFYQGRLEQGATDPTDGSRRSGARRGESSVLRHPSLASMSLRVNATQSTRAVVATEPTKSDQPQEIPPDHGTQAGSDGSSGASADGKHDRTAWTPEQLGLGQGNSVSASNEASPIQAEMRARLAHGARLEQSIRQDVAERSGKLGLGEEGPILSKLEELALRHSGDLTGYATIAARISANGSVDLELLGTSSDDAAWRRLLERAKRELAARHIPAPRSGHGVALEIRVDSRVQLPSGADPGFSVKLFGLTLKNGEGKRSPGAEILSSLPRLEINENEKDPALRRRLVVDILRIPLDVADLSGKRTRMVSARVLRRTAL